MLISVVIPTFNSEKVITRVLKAVFNGEHLPDEVIIVDGGSRDQTVNYAREFPVKVYHNPKVHAAAARNIGIRYSSGSVIAFTDSDCVPCEDWLSRIYHHFVSNDNLIGVGGRMLPLPPVNRIEEFSGHVFLNEIMRFPLESFYIQKRTLAGSLITANCAYLRDALIHVDGFRDVFGNNAEDIDLFWRLLGQGNLFYDPNVLVYHSFPNSKRRLAKKYFQYGVASSKLARYHLSTPAIDWFIYRKLFKNLIKLFIPKQDKELAFLYSLQLTSHIIGKAVGSIIVRRINL
jgi:glycosyltransferase involved in cell wall biosynthesis